MRRAMLGVILLAATTAYAGDEISPPYGGPRLGNLQCLIRNNSTRAIYAIPEWIECDTRTSVAMYGGKELTPGENFNLVSTEPRACRCRVTFDGKVGEVTIYLASGTGGPKPGTPGKSQCCGAGTKGCNWISAVGCP